MFQPGAVPITGPRMGMQCRTILPGAGGNKLGGLSRLRSALCLLEEIQRAMGFPKKGCSDWVCNPCQEANKSGGFPPKAPADPTTPRREDPLEGEGGGPPAALAMEINRRFGGSNKAATPRDRKKSFQANGRSWGAPPVRAPGVADRLPVGDCTAIVP